MSWKWKFLSWMWKALLESDANSSDYVSVTYEGDGSGTVVAADAGAVAPVSINTGADNAYLTFTSQDFGSDQFVGLKVLQGTLATTSGSVGGSDSESPPRPRPDSD